MVNLSIIELFVLLFFVLFLAILVYAVFRRFVRSACKKTEKESGGRDSTSGSGQQSQESRVVGQVQVGGGGGGGRRQNIQTIYLGNTNEISVGSSGVRSSIYTIPIRGGRSRGGDRHRQTQNFVVVVRPFTEPPPPSYEECVPPPPPAYSPSIDTV